MSMNSPSATAETTESQASAPAEATLGSFSPYVGEKFDLLLGEGHAEPLELITASASKYTPAPGHREPFQLIFRAGTRTFYVPQGIYALQHPAAGSFEIFIVPIGPDDAGMCFQAIYS